jgi:outer membrane lipoprotein-sorting protein
MKKLAALTFAAALMSLISLSYAPAQTLSGIEILNKIDENYVARNRVTTSTMIIKGRRGTRMVKSRSWMQGTKKAFTEYLAPAREKGTKMLKLEDELWIWTPSTDRTIKIAGHMLRQSLLGSDISYEDFMEDHKMSEIYEPEVVGEEDIGGRTCYVLELTARIEKTAYHSRKLWVDKERYLPLREDLFARSGKLIKYLKILEVFKVEERWYPKKMIFKDVLKKGDGTEFIIDSIEFNVEIPEHIFTKASLKR